MMEKMSLEQFQQIKNQLAQLLKEADDDYDTHKNDYNYDPSVKDQILIEQYFVILNHLSQYDLSDIPFEAWQGMEIFSDETHVLDFSKTRANIDFDLVDYSENCNYSGCNIRNLENVSNFLNSKNFDEKVIRENSSLFLSDLFSEEFKEKFYSRLIQISDLVSLSSQQLDEIKQKKFLYYQENNELLEETLGIDKILQLYKYSSEDYAAVNKLVSWHFSYFINPYIGSKDLPTYEELLQQLKNADVSKLKDICFDYVRKLIINSRILMDQYRYPELFIRENSDIFLIDSDVPDEVKQRYFSRELKLRDLLDYPDAFSNIQIDYFMDSQNLNLGNIGSDDYSKYYGNYICQFVKVNYGVGKFQKLIQKYPDIFEYIIEHNDFHLLNSFLKAGKDLDSTFVNAVKEYFLKYRKPENFRVVNEEKTIYNVPSWLSTINLQFVDVLNTKEELLQYNDFVTILDRSQRIAINILGIDNIKRFEQETGFFTHNGDERSNNLKMLTAFGDYFYMNTLEKLKRAGIDFKNGSLSYEDFLTQFAKLLNHMRKNYVFADIPSYDWIQGDFRDNYPEIFMDLNAPNELRNSFYKNEINLKILYKHKDYIKYLVNKNLLNTVNVHMELATPGLIDDQGQIVLNYTNFMDEYISRYGNEKFLELCVKYGECLNDINILCFHDEIENEQAIEQLLRNAIYNKILKEKVDYSSLVDVSDFVADYPEIFVNFDNLNNISQEEKQRLTNAYYNGKLSFEDIKKYPELVNVLKDKNLSIAFGIKDGNHYDGRIILDNGYGRTEKKYSDLELLQVFGNEKFLQLCAKYGRYMDGIVQYLNKDITIRNGKYVDFNQNNIDFDNGLSFEEISKRIEDIIVRESKLGNISYTAEDAPNFLKENNPELFLEEDVPEELKRYFYNYSNNYPMSFEILQKHKDWMPFLKGKALTASLFRNNYLKKELMQYFELFGEEKGIRLGINRAETVKEMMKSHQVDLMKRWYDKTGGKFIPDFVVMQNFRLEEADKFLASGSNWSNLMRIQSFARIPESRDAMLKLAYSFGAFDQDQRGFKKLQYLLTGLPRKIDADKGYIIDQIDYEIDLYSQRRYFYKNVSISSGNRYKIESSDMTTEEKEKAYNKMMEYIKKNNFIDFIDTPTLVNLLEMLQKEKVDIDFSKPLFAQIYRKNEDGTYSLTINSQIYPKSAQIIRNILEKFREFPILTPDKAHQLFGGFELKYDADFREFLLANMDQIIENSEYVSFVSSIQKQFSDIKAINSNRALTWELAVSYVQTNKFTSVNVGNERAAEVSAIAGYSQADFNTLQQIYNYGKQRTFSSIPRIEQSAEKISGKYTYETLRLDDPLAMAIGTLTDCCQELNNCAEVCMEHSMVDKNGRVFVIKDEQGNIVAQSWVWRNKDVLCFDNIEIPDKAFARTIKEHPELGRKGFTDEIFEIYKQAAHDLIETDDKVYKELFESGKITQEQYDGLRLGKVTVGLGYNDIAESLKQNSVVDKGTISRPLSFEEPVKLSRGLYTNDSTTQYILEEREDRKEYIGETLPVHSDAYIEYTDDNFTEKSLLSLEKLELVTKEDPRNLDTSVSDYADSGHLVTEIARNYGLNPETTRIVMNPNFAIIYDVNGDMLKVGDLLFNTRVDNDQQQIDIESQVIMQISLALGQIASDKEIDVSSLNEKQKEMYEKIIGLTNEIDIERGVGYAK